MVIQILLLILSSIFICAVLGLAQPILIPKDNYYMIAREAVIIIVADLFLIASDPALTANQKGKFGITIVIIVGLYLAIMISLMAISVVSVSKQKVKRHYAKKSYVSH